MATATASTIPATVRVPRLVVLAAYLVALVTAEVLLALGDAWQDPGYQEAALAVHILLVFALIGHGVLVYPRSPVFSSLFVALSLASLIRVYSLALPPIPGTEGPGQEIPRLAVVSVPLLVSVVAVAYVQRLHPKELGLSILWGRPALLQIAIALVGLPLGVAEYFILRPEGWIASPADLGAFAAGTAVIFTATGISEEIIFRGILLKRAIEGLGERRGLLFVSLAFTALHIFFRSGVDLAFVFGVALFYGTAALRTKSLWGVIGSHTLANVVLYLVAPSALA